MITRERLNELKDKGVMVFEGVPSREVTPINLSDNNMELYEDFERTDLLGECDYKSAKITISTKLDSQLLHSTIVHELTHAYLFEYGVYDKEYSNENVCNFFGAYGKEIIGNAELVYNHYQGNKGK